MTTMLGRRAFLKGVGGAASAVLLGACNPAPPRAQGGRPTVRVVSWTDLGFPSAFTYTGGPGYWRMSLVFDTLLWPDATGTLLPWLASSYERSDDGLVHTLELRNVRWDDGKPLTARDVAFTYEYHTTKTFTPLLIGVPPPGIAVQPKGDRTVEFRLERPNATFPQQVLGTMPIVPEHVWSKIPDPMSVQDARALVSTGAYSLESRNVTQGTESYLAKDGYFLGTPFVKRIQMVPAANDDPLTALRIGELDGAASAAEGVRNEVLAPFRDDPAYGIVSRDAGFGFPLFFNMSRGGAMADLRFRRACVHAIDRDGIVQGLLTGNGQVGSAGWLPPSHTFYEPGVRSYPFDRVEAERLLDEGGYRRGGGGFRTNPDGSRLRPVLNIPDSVPLNLAEAVFQSLSAVGLDIDFQRVDLVRLFGFKLDKTYDLLVTAYPGPSGIGPEMDPDLLRGVYHSNPPNPTHHATGYSNPTVDRLLEEQVATFDVEERKRLVSQIQLLVAEDLPVAMLYYTTFFFAFRKDVFDQWYFTPGGFGPGIPDVYNKHPYIIGRKEGLEPRQ